ncbi:MAG: phosphotransferase [Pseudomonadota bacterium]
MSADPQSVSLHDNELQVDQTLVESLVSAHFPKWAKLEVQPLRRAGSSNHLFRLGDDLLVRLPRQPGGGRSLVKEAYWSDEFRSKLPLSIPKVVELVEPEKRFPQHWAVMTWLPGQVPDVHARAVDAQFAQQLAGFIVCLRDLPVPTDITAEMGLTGYRGAALAEHDEQFRVNLRVCHGMSELSLPLQWVERIWEDGLSAQDSEVVNATWYHGDLVAENLLSNGVRLAAVLDFGGLGVGDPAIDLIGAWELFDGRERSVFRAAVKATQNQWRVARAWAVAVALMTFPYYLKTMPRRINDRLCMLNSVVDEWREENS